VGIGACCAFRLAEAGASVVLADVNPNVAKTADELVKKGFKATGVTFDVSKVEEADSFVKRIVDQFGSIDILINNAGVYPMSSLLEETVEHFDRIFNVNIRGLVFLTKSVAKQMIKQGKGGKIVNLASIAGLHPFQNADAYVASKHAVIGFTKNAALELAPYKINVNAVAPGVILTPGLGEVDKTMIEAIEKNTPLGRMGDPDEMARACLFLSTDLSSYLQGATIVADGGSLLK